MWSNTDDDTRVNGSRLYDTSIQVNKYNKNLHIFRSIGQGSLVKPWYTALVILLCLLMKPGQNMSLVHQSTKNLIQVSFYLL